jgi:hypothetical protein
LIKSCTLPVPQTKNRFFIRGTCLRTYHRREGRNPLIDRASTTSDCCTPFHVPLHVPNVLSGTGMRVGITSSHRLSPHDQKPYKGRLSRATLRYQIRIVTINFRMNVLFSMPNSFEKYFYLGRKTSCRLMEIYID